MLDPNRPIFIGTFRYVAALDPGTGTELWRTKLPTSTGSIVSLLFSDGLLFAGHAGNMYCLEPKSGTILWQNKLPRMGFQAVIMTREGASAADDAALAAQTAMDDAASSADAG